MLSGWTVPTQAPKPGAHPVPRLRLADVQGGVWGGRRPTTDVACFHRVLGRVPESHAAMRQTLAQHVQALGEAINADSGKTPNASGVAGATTLDHG